MVSQEQGNEEKYYFPEMWHHYITANTVCSLESTSGVARAFPGGQVAHPEGQNEEENSKVRGKIDQNLRKKIRKVELLPTRGSEAGYGPGINTDTDTAISNRSRQDRTCPLH